MWLGHPHASRESEVLIEFKSLNNPVGAAQLWSSSSPQIQFPMKLTGSAFLYLFIVQPPPFPQQQTWGKGGTFKDVFIKLAMNGEAGQVVVLPVLAMVIFGCMMSTEPSRIPTHSEILTVFLLCE
jgi:hypothetical protein